MTTKPHPAAAYHERRRKEIDEKIRKAAIDYLFEVGYVNFTIEGLSARSGIAKTTIYRRGDDAAQIACWALHMDKQTLEQRCTAIFDALDGTTRLEASIIIAEMLARIDQL